MKTILSIIILLLSSITMEAQEISGQWNGILKVQGTQLRLVFNVTKNEKDYSSTMDSPDQGAKGIPITKTTFENSIIQFEITNARIEYLGQLKGDEIVGTFKQGGLEFPMTLSRKAIEKETINRPQEPSKPYSYYSDDVIFQNNKDKIALSGTLTLPKKEGVFPAVVLISGSGPQNRDEELLGHKPFLVLADHLTKNGIAVLRYDDRGVGESKGNFKTASSADFATDVESAIVYLKTRKEINKKKIGLIGHSEGGLIAPMIASKSKDISFIVLLAGTGIQGDQLLLLQQELIARASGVPETEIKKSFELNKIIFDIVVKSNDEISLNRDLKNALNEMLKNDATIKIPSGMTKDEFISMQINQISSPWMQYFLRYNPAFALEKVKCPVLAINGEKDLQVPPKQNLAAIKNALDKGGNKNVSIKELPNLNLLFQDCKTGAPDEYATIKQTFSSRALDEITQWLKLQSK